MGLKDALKGAIDAFVEAWFEMWNATVGALIRGLLTMLNDLITQTPYPKCKHAAQCDSFENAPLVFGEPVDGTWADLWAIYTEGAQPYAYVLWIIAVITVQFSGIFEGVLGQVDSEKSKKKLFVAFLGITMWWPLGVTILAFSDALGDMLYGIAAGYGDGDPDGIGLVAAYEHAENRMMDSGASGIAGLAVMGLLLISEAAILLILALLWMIRIFAIYVLMPLMPILIALWAFDIPGLDPLQGLAGKALNAFTSLAFITIPGAIIVGFTGTIMDIVTDETNEATGSDIDSSGAEGSMQEGEFVVNQPDATADPVGSFSGAVETSTSGEVGAMGPGDIPMDASPGEFTTSILFIAMALAVPLVAGLSPIIMAKALGGKEALGAAGFLANPAGSLASGAMSAAKGADKASAGVGLAKTFKSDGVSGVKEALDADDDDEKPKFLKNRYQNRVEKASGSATGALGAGIETAEGAHSIGSRGAAFATEKGTDFKNAGKDMFEDAAGKAPDREAAWSAFGTAADLAQNPSTMGTIAKRNAVRTADKAVGEHVEDAVETAKEAPDKAKAAPGAALSRGLGAAGSAQESIGQRAGAAASKMSEVKARAEMEAKVSGAKSETALRVEHEVAPDERRMTEQQQEMLETMGVADTADNIKKGMHSDTFDVDHDMPDGMMWASPDEVPDHEVTEYLEAQHDVPEETLKELYDDPEMETQFEDLVEEARKEVFQSVAEGDIQHISEQLDDDAMLKEVAERQAGMDITSQQEFELDVELSGMDEFGEFNVATETTEEEHNTNMAMDVLRREGEISW